ncbi:MAG: hypothetical protein J6A05_00635 [Oscillospiraceae bacterium]|nr:hypothetical protein [Oscillospiraceae bacterium]
MKSKTKLIKLSGELDSSADYASFYEFAVNYIHNMKNKKCLRTDVFFNDILNICDPQNIEENKIYLGISGENVERIIEWRNKLEAQKSALIGLELDELQYVMGYCARLSKIAKMQ